MWYVYSCANESVIAPFVTGTVRFSNITSACSSAQFRGPHVAHASSSRPDANAWRPCVSSRSNWLKKRLVERWFMPSRRNFRGSADRWQCVSGLHVRVAEAHVNNS
jgi:hypothetical protein